MIDEKKLIEEIQGRQKYYESKAAEYDEAGERYEYLMDVCNGKATELTATLSIINEQPKVGDWIPSSERLPEEPETCIVTIYSRDAHAGRGIYGTYAEGFVYFDGENWLDLDGQKLPYKVLAWQPLPEPWEGGKE
jgi:hypothetical protein